MVTPIDSLNAPNPFDPEHPILPFDHDLIVETIESTLDAQGVSWEGCIACCSECLDATALARYNVRADIKLLVLFALSNRICEMRNQLPEALCPETAFALIKLFDCCLDAELARCCDPVVYAFPLILYSQPGASMGPYEALDHLLDVARAHWPSLTTAKLEAAIEAWKLHLDLLISKKNLRHSQ
ncbi:MAG: hypothetical protein KDK78_04410 [Chlamydiia bacterium]|nr:hypothetical protein [Chlamydiia bacterium]